MPENAQTELFTEIDVELFLIAPAERNQRCTAKQAAKIEQVLSLIRLLVSYGCPAAEITREAKVHERVVNAVILRDVDLATSTKTGAAETLRKVGARWIGKAITQEDTADFKDLVAAGNAMLQRAAEATAGMGLEAQEKNASQMLDAAGTGAPSALAEIRRLLGLPEPALDPGLTGNPPTKHLPQDGELEDIANHDADDGERTDRRPRVTSGGGVSASDGAEGIPMGQENSENFGEDSPPESPGVCGKILGDDPPPSEIGSLIADVEPTSGVDSLPATADRCQQPLSE